MNYSLPRCALIITCTRRTRAQRMALLLIRVRAHRFPECIWRMRSRSSALASLTRRPFTYSDSWQLLDIVMYKDPNSIIGALLWRNHVSSSGMRLAVRLVRYRKCRGRPDPAWTFNMRSQLAIYSLALGAGSRPAEPAKCAIIMIFRNIK
jgi:hypothetical protein